MWAVLEEADPEPTQKILKVVRERGLQEKEENDWNSDSPTTPEKLAETYFSWRIWEGNAYPPPIGESTHGLLFFAYEDTDDDDTSAWYKEVKYARLWVNIEISLDVVGSPWCCRKVVTSSRKWNKNRIKCVWQRYKCITCKTEDPDLLHCFGDLSIKKLAQRITFNCNRCRCGKDGVICSKMFYGMVALRSMKVFPKDIVKLVGQIGSKISGH